MTMVMLEVGAAFKRDAKLARAIVALVCFAIIALGVAGLVSALATDARMDNAEARLGRLESAHAGLLEPGK